MKTGISLSEKGKKKVIYFLLFLSGFASLVYQVLFTRLFNITFGLFIHSTVSVLLSYMVGLALGYFVSRFIISKDNFLLYGWLELLIGLYGMAFLLVFPLLDNLFFILGNYLIVKISLSFLSLIIPTTMMGITVPIIIQYLNQSYQGNYTYFVYGINALGGSLGAILSSIFFINIFGIYNSFFITFLVNLVIFVVVSITQKNVVTTLSFEKIGKPEVKYFYMGLIALVIGLNGMGLEIIWYRLLVYLVANNTFSFSIILSVVIAGISLGSLVYRKAKNIFKSDEKILSFSSIVVGTYLVFTITLLNASFDTMEMIYNVFGNIVFSILGDTKLSETITLTISRYLQTSLVILIPAMISGLIIPTLFSILKSYNLGSDQAIAGNILFYNTLGSVLGVLLTTYVLIPTIGFSGSIILFSVLYAISPLLLKELSSIKVLLKGRIIFYYLFFLLAMIVLPKDITFTKVYNGFLRINGDLLYYKEGLYGTISVFDLGNTRILKINGIDEVPTDYEGIFAFKVLGSLPALLKVERSNVMVNAMGGGITLSSFLHYTSNSEIVKVVDICPDVKDALILFSNYNENVFKKTNWFFTAEDGRNAIKSYRGKFDIIIADATHPASAESWMLFTKEFYEKVREKLNPDGIFAQWVPLHNLSTYDFASIIKTFNHTFPESFLLITGIYTVLVGKNGSIEHLHLNSNNLDKLGDLGIQREEQIKSLVVLSPEGFDRIKEGEILSDYRSSVEFAEFHRRVSEDQVRLNLEFLAKHFDTKEISRFTGLPENITLSTKLTIDALIEYRKFRHYESLKLIDKSLSLYPQNFYANHLFRLIFPEFVTLLYKHRNEIIKNYSLDVFRELITYASNNMNRISN